LVLISVAAVLTLACLGGVSADASEAATAHAPQIFEVTISNCTTFHVGYNYFPAGTIVGWRVDQTGTPTLAKGSFTTLGGGRTFHFVSIPLGITLKPEPAQTHIRFAWTIGGVTTNYEVTRDPGCVAAGHLYWPNQFIGTIAEANLDGTNPQTIAVGQSEPFGVAVDAQHLYWANFGGTIVEANLDGTNQKTIASGQNVPSGVAVNAQHLYWTNQNDGTIVEANLDGTNQKTIATGQNVPSGVAVDAQHMYWSNRSGGTIVEANLDGTSQKTIATGQNGPFGVAVDAQLLYWTDFLGGTIVKANLDGTNQKTIATGQDLPAGVAVDAQHLYWSNAIFTIVAANLDGTNQKTIVTGQGGVGLLTVSG
jgi:sugar lactone lactonase YvrE